MIFWWVSTFVEICMLLLGLMTAAWSIARKQLPKGIAEWLLWAIDLGFILGWIF